MQKDEIKMAFRYYNSCSSIKAFGKSYKDKVPTSKCKYGSQLIVVSFYTVVAKIYILFSLPLPFRDVPDPDTGIR